jgi:hypothetical protein
MARTTALPRSGDVTPFGLPGDLPSGERPDLLCRGDNFRTSTAGAEHLCRAPAARAVGNASGPCRPGLKTYRKFSGAGGSRFGTAVLRGVNDGCSRADRTGLSAAHHWARFGE